MTTNNTDNKVILTKEGFDALTEELNKLVEVDRPAVVKDIQDARAMGDLSENGMYTAAREKQSFIEGRIKELEHIIKNAEVVENTNKSLVGLGSKIRIASEKQEFEYHIVSPEEVDFKSGKISHESPIGQAVIGHKVGDVFEVSAPAGTIKYKIIEIK